MIALSLVHILYLLTAITPTLGASIPSHPGKPTVYLIRHGEKPPDPSDSGLNADGFKRAECLRSVFGANSPYNIGHIMAPHINLRKLLINRSSPTYWLAQALLIQNTTVGQHRRSYETVLPLAADLSLPIDTSCKRNHVRCVARKIRGYRGLGNILISWRHGKMAEIVSALGSENPPVYPEERFDLIWTIPWPFDNVTRIESEGCFGLDDRVSGSESLNVKELVVQSLIGDLWTACWFLSLAEMDDIEERLRDHAQAFDGLLSLIPAKNYYGEDGSDQWQKKKQTKEQAREAKRAKLDPDNVKTAKDVMDENARKRKRNEEQAGEEAASEDGELGSEKPREGLKRGDAKAKKQKQIEGPADAGAQKSNEAAEARRKLKEDKKAQKKASQKEKKKAKEASRKAKEAEQQSKQDQTSAAEVAQGSKPASASENVDNEIEAKDSDESDSAEGVVPEEGLSLEFDAEQDETESSSASTPNSSGFDASNPQSGSSSISSIAPSTDASKTSTSNDLKPLKPTSEQLKQRLQKRLDELRAARHADGLNGKPARNRQELIEARRQKAEQRKAHKKELRQKAREEEQRLKDEAMARRFSPGGSGSLLASPRSPADSVSSSNANYSFGRVVFGDGQHADPTLQSVRDGPKRHAANDPAAALKAVEAKKARLASMDDERRADIEEKDMWLNAKKRAHGERVRDDTSLLKKALKRKETAKKKSEREWKERIDAVKHGKEVRQQKREENLRKRREEKGGNKGKKKPAAGGGKKKARPGFEGSFKAKSGGGKKK
ncbi:putative 60S ribosome biogenesis protein Rrp14 [Aspergillus saccharolyticus JOP 1030-1]|uniref:SURF6-domain-containing protein n=1 Tax=Aspergillus saccharolyticus JOP 1030-1 TaxID=1450539 RepID=A0A318ZII5_9EURO|nr:SURF6-domain-containing protein [Aspergillus saccharolyticus JOP 1030-1]PYH46144.1 SURF6-domain-containing protein [Aspergillus saccharolyticus JOP 1030-1]